jgi:hypothetical protein
MNIQQTIQPGILKGLDCLIFVSLFQADHLLKKSAAFFLVLGLDEWI